MGESTHEENEIFSLNSRKTYNTSEWYFGLNLFDLYSPETLTNLARDPIGNNDLLRKVSAILYGTNGTYTNTVDYMTAMPTLSKVIVPRGESEERKKRNKELMASVLETIKDKEIIRDALFRGMLEGVAFYYFETTGDKQFPQTMSDIDVNSISEINRLGINASIVSLPVDYTRIVGFKNSSYVLAFNLEYFDEASGESPEKKLLKYPKDIRDAYYKRRSGNSSNNWLVLDNNKTIVHKIRSKREEKWGRPLCLAAINDILYSDYFTQTKRNVLDEVNNRIVYQTYPEGERKGVCALTGKQQREQHEAVRDAVLTKNSRGGMSFFSVAAGTKLDTIDVKNTEILDNDYESNLGDKIALGLGISGSLLNGVGSGTYASQQSNLELLSSQIFQWVEQIEAELNKCINACIIKDSSCRVDVKYLPITHINKKQMVGFTKELYLQGCGSLSLWSAACGIAPEVFFAILDQENEQGIYDKYKPHITSYTYNGEEVGGRPETDEPTESTLRGQSVHSNEMPSPSD